MNIVKFNRHRPVPFNHLFDEFFNGNISDFIGSDVVSNQPAVNIIEEDDGFVIELAAPGLSKDSFDIRIDKNQLIVNSVKSENKEESDEKTKYKRREFTYASFTRSFTLPNTIDKTKIDGVYEDGILSISLKKREEAIDKAPITITVK